MPGEPTPTQPTTPRKISLRQLIAAAVFLTAVFIRPPQLANNSPVADIQNNTPRVLVIEQPTEDALTEVPEQ